MKILLFLYIICQLNYSKSAIYTIEDVFKILNNLTETEENLKIILDNLSETLNKVYVYNEIYKNPPQSSFDNNYHIKINIQEKLKNININGTNPYQFYQDIKIVLDSLGDHHLAFGGDIIINYLNFLQPIKLNIREVDNKYRIFAETIAFSDFFKYFKNNETIFDIIRNNINIPIKSINGKDPFDYIMTFGGVFKKLKSPQASFRYKFINYNQQTLANYPLSFENLTNFTVIYDNGDAFTTDYIVYTTKDLTETDFIKENKFFNFNKNNKEEIDYRLLLNNASINEEKNVYKSQDNNVKNKKKNFLTSIDWDYDSDLSIYCKADNSKKINVYLVNNFNIHESTRYIKTIKNCVDLFDNNDYPIILINIFNQGGLIHDAQLFLELLSPRTTINIYGAFRNIDIFNGSEIFNNEILSLFSDSKKCDILNYENLTKKVNKIDYGDQIEDTLSDIVIFNGKKFRKEVNTIKKNLKNPRKPTEILVYTDGYSFSAGAIMIKFLQYYGGGITAGYFQNPNINNIPYDSGSCASALFSYNILQTLDIKEYKILDKYNCYLSVPGAQIFYTPNDLKHPLEYEITQVDEIVNIYPKFENSFNLLNQEEYDNFINESLKIFKKYETKCNPNNKKLLLLTNECDEKFGNNYTHGGYKCGEDGFWSKECVASYCDIGYIFDYSKSKCVIDICSDEYKPEPESEEEESKSDESKSDEDESGSASDQSGPETESESKQYTIDNFILFIIIIVFVILIIIIIITIILYKAMKRKKLKKEIESIDNMNLDEQIITK